MSTFENTVNFIGLSGKIVGALALVAVSLLFVYQDKLLYMPNPPGFPVTPDENPEMCRSPGEWSVEGRENLDGVGIPFEEEMLDTSDGQKIHVWLLLNENSQNVPTLIYFHGNAGNMGFRLQNAVQMYSETGINILMMDYRGYGLYFSTIIL